MCLSCHADFDRFMLLTDREEINVVESHDWLPNQVAHFRSVRCIECHTEINDSILIAHKILPKTEAVENCTECHSRDSQADAYTIQIPDQGGTKSWICQWNHHQQCICDWGKPERMPQQAQLAWYLRLTFLVITISFHSAYYQTEKQLTWQQQKYTCIRSGSGSGT